MEEGRRGIGSHRRVGSSRRWQRVLLVVAAVLASGPGAPVADPPAGPFRSDDFAGAALGPHWERVTPHGVGSVRLAGAAGTGHWLALSVPAGVNHNPWTANEAVRAVQLVPDGDLSVEARFDSVPFARYQMQGLTVAQSETTFLRYGVHHDGSGLRLFASTTVDGAPEVVVDDELPDLDTVYLRIDRTGLAWTLSWSADGASWSVGATLTHAMAVAEVGPFAGNYDPAGNAPAFTALVDRVVDRAAPAAPVTQPTGPPADLDTAPPSVSGVAPDTRPASARLTWVTDEVTTGVVEYGLTDAYGEEAPVPAPGTGHAVTLTGLEPATSYHYRVVAEDLAGNATATGDAVFTTDEVGRVEPFVPDDFDTGELGPQWHPVTPLGVGEVAPAGPAVPGGQLALSVPAGHNHHPWTVNDALRAVQLVPDTDLSVAARFTSMPSRRNQMQGLTVGESRIAFLRYGVHHDGSGLRLFASVTMDRAPTTVVDTPLPALAAVSLRVARTGDDWTLAWSADGASWSELVRFTQRMVVTEVGPFAGSYDEAGRAPGFTALVDQVRGGAERPGGGGGAGPLEITDLRVDTSTNHVELRWVTSATATAHVEYGPDRSYGATSDPTTPGTLHRVLLTDLALGTAYRYRVVAVDEVTGATRTEEGSFTTAATNTGPTITLWYGTHQSFGPTRGQRWVNVLGNVSDADGVVALSYTVNGAGPRPLALGPDRRRLQWPGDFNVDIPVDALRPGENRVTLTASDGRGLVTTRTVTVEWRSGDGAALPYTLRWRPGVSPAEQAQVVDGAWTVTDEGLRTGITGYDRLVAVGDVGWSDYELTVPVTVHALGPAAYTYLSGAPVIGVGLRWNGHTAVDDAQPAWDWYPTGAFAWYRFHERGARLELSGNEGEPDEHASVPLELGETYLLKVRVETLDGATRYQTKLWPADGQEPGFWFLEIVDGDGPGSGAIVLIAHQLAGTFGDLTVEPLDAATGAAVGASR
jgi:hypothetical protein